jgi:hypothetical protein
MVNVGACFGFFDSLVPLASMWSATSETYACVQALRVITGHFSRVWTPPTQERAYQETCTIMEGVRPIK